VSGPRSISSRNDSSQKSDTRKIIPVNKHGERLDTQNLGVPTKQQWDVYSQQVNKKEICDFLKLTGVCDSPKCHIDHRRTSKGALYALRYKLGQEPCENGSRCRVARCYKSHVCTKRSCLRRSPSWFCPFPHPEDRKVFTYVAPSEDTSKNSGDENQATTAQEQILSNGINLIDL
jgi:hypothetical protein